MTDILLEGCTSRPLASYLKALGVLRLVGEQRDAHACGAWRNGRFFLSTSLSRKELCDFFLHDWHPTPLVSPWNAGSGFYPKEANKKYGLDLLMESQDPRLVEYRDVICRIREWPEFRELAALPKAQAMKKRGEVLEKNKTRFLQRCRSELPEACLPWLDAACILGAGKPQFAPLLRTGGNEGNMEYTNNFMQYVNRVFLPANAQASHEWLESALFAVPTRNLPIMATGQFDPGRTGGCNQGRGFDADMAPVNPWDFILMLEGTLLFAGALARRSAADPAQVSFPFSVKYFAAGFASSGVDNREARELWLPFWVRPASLREVRRLLSEGRATVGRRQAADGLDFAQSIASLGVERGIDCFERYSFLERRGQSYVALPSGTLSVRYRPEVSLLKPVARFLEQRCLKKGEDPNTLKLARRRLKRAVFACTRTPDAHHFQALSRELAQMDALPKLPTLLESPCSELEDGWISACDDGGPEVRIAAALASLKNAGKLGPLRAQIAPVVPFAPSRWAKKDSAQSIPCRGPVLESLGSLFLHRLLLAQRFDVSPLKASVRLDPADLLPLLYGTLDMALLQDLVRAFSLVRRPISMPRSWKRPLCSQRLPYALALLKLLYTPLPRDCGLDTKRLTPELRIARLVQAHRLEEACMLAAQRLRIAGGSALFLPASFTESLRGLTSAAIVACLAVPVAPRTLLSHLYQRPAERSVHAAG